MKLLVLSIVSILISCGSETIAQTVKIPNFHYVNDNIYRSGELTAANLPTVKAQGIKSIISMKTDIKDISIEREFSKANGIDFINIPINILIYNDANKQKFKDVYKMITIMPRPLLVHCSRGSDRTGVAISMVRILINKWSYKKAIDEMYGYDFNPMFFMWHVFFLKDLSNTHQ
jgi:protein tyrosine/serine phosphatase